MFSRPQKAGAESADLRGIKSRSDCQLGTCQARVPRMPEAEGTSTSTELPYGDLAKDQAWRPSGDRHPELYTCQRCVPLMPSPFATGPSAATHNTTTLLRNWSCGEEARGDPQPCVGSPGICHMEQDVSPMGRILVYPDGFCCTGSR